MAASSDSWGVGDSVVLLTTLGEEITSTVFGFDKVTNILMLRETGAHNGVANLRLLKASYIDKVVSVAKPAPGAVDLGPLPPVDMERGKRREAKALQQAERDAALVGVGVTKEAQSIFESLKKTLPCHWDGRDIVVLVSIDSVHVTHSNLCAWAYMEIISACCVEAARAVVCAADPMQLWVLRYASQLLFLCACCPAACVAGRGGHQGAVHPEHLLDRRKAPGDVEPRQDGARS